MEENKKETDEQLSKDLTVADIVRFAALSAISKEPLFKNFSHERRVIGNNFVANDFVIDFDNVKQSYRLVIIKYAEVPSEA